MSDEAYRPAFGAIPTARPRPEGLDPGIREVVWRLCDAGIHTFESCEGGEGHAYPEPTVRFHGQPDEGWRAYAAIANGKYGIRVWALKRVWSIEDGEPSGPFWELTVRQRGVL